MSAHRIAVQPLALREKEILQRIAQGKTTVEAASDMDLSAGSVKAHLVLIGGRLGVLSRPAMVHLAYGYGQMDVPKPLKRVVVLTEPQQKVLEGIADDRTVEEIAGQEQRPLADVRKDARLMVRALGASSPPHAVTRAWQFGLLGNVPALADPPVIAAETAQ
ncbi:LuxR C-terminal-related transcriptional regulator [Streptomyces sp. NPDC050704]|uniref:LuxR C-terminal-related transcriptional regulator n=1 Tax=Streptomyces sp. NPDC050704 TaxID=3157219 RepID=UPI00344AE735